MYCFTTLCVFSIAIFNGLQTSIAVNSEVRLIAVTEMPFNYLYKLYQEERNNGTAKLRTRALKVSSHSQVLCHVSDAPSKLNPSIRDAATRLRICDDISNSGVFEIYGDGALEAVDMTQIYSELQEPKYSSLFHRIYSPAPKSQNSQHALHVYTNSYTKQEFVLTKFALNQNHEYTPVSFANEEYVFVCLLKRKNSKDIVPFYVTKEYDMQYGRRYVFLNTDTEIMLAEKPAKSKVRPDFNVELHYIEVRKRRESGTNL